MLFCTAKFSRYLSKPAPWPAEWWNYKQSEDVGVRSAARVLLRRLGRAGVELLVSKAGRSEGEMKAAVSGRGLRKEVQTFADCNDVQQQSI